MAMTEARTVMIPEKYQWMKPGQWAMDNHGFRCMIGIGPHKPHNGEGDDDWWILNDLGLPVVCDFLRPAPVPDSARVVELEAENERLKSRCQIMENRAKPNDERFEELAQMINELSEENERLKGFEKACNELAERDCKTESELEQAKQIIAHLKRVNTASAERWTVAESRLEQVRAVLSDWANDWVKLSVEFVLLTPEEIHEALAQLDRIVEGEGKGGGPSKRADES